MIRIDEHDIELAVHGDSIALEKVVKHFLPIIKDASLVIRDHWGHMSVTVNDEKLQQIAAHLMCAVLKFDYTRYTEGCENGGEQE